MPIVLYRVDERLIHGQVVVGWSNLLHPDRFVVVDDELAGSVWEHELYALALPTDVEATFATVADARALLDGWRTGKQRVVLLTRDIASMRRLAESGALRGEQVNLGGLHHAAGRKPVLPYLYLSEGERAELAHLVEGGAVVSARDLPGARRVDADQLLREDAHSP
ncbi:MAG: PTS system mannose/fructose/N-acetylgalactosamine-transporter subunit IIB [Longimicrobiales bacterium]